MQISSLADQKGLKKKKKNGIINYNYQKLKLKSNRIKKRIYTVFQSRNITQSRFKSYLTLELVPSIQEQDEQLDYLNEESKRLKLQKYSLDYLEDSQYFNNSKKNQFFDDFCDV
ncbi:unnamed protein product [Paramecium pentaurelia]|uniref:Uncharacterized protein n=1 Tax=Paramecium pentaurelia TaxID=43138 RepID=A0A8S1VWR8_9CILI|nr:unnamed protein product [Paramecium pentaurelia]